MTASIGLTAATLFRVIHAAGRRSERKRSVISRRGSCHAANALVTRWYSLSCTCQNGSADEIRHDEDTRRDPFPLQDRKRVLVNVAIAVVERHRGHRLVEAPAAGEVLADLVEGDEREMAADAVEVPLEHPAADEHARHLSVCSGAEALDHAVVAEDERPLGPAGQRRRKTVVVRARNRRREHRFETPAPLDRGSRPELPAPLQTRFHDGSQGQHAAGQRGQPSSRCNDTAMKPAADVCGERTDLMQLPFIGRPEPFVRLRAPQHVERLHAFVDRRANRERHQHQADALVAIPFVEPVLIEIELAVVGEAVHHCRRCAVQPKHVHPQPAAVERSPCRVVMKCAKRRREKRRRAALRLEAPLVEAEEGRQRFLPLRLGRHPFKRRIELLVERPQAPPHVGAMRAAARGQVRLPRVAGQIDDRTNPVG